MVIHPTSVFATDPEVLLLPEEESRDMGNATGTQLTIFFRRSNFFAVDRFTFFVSTISQSRPTFKVALFIILATSILLEGLFSVIHCFESQNVSA